MPFGARVFTFVLCLYLGVKLLTQRMCICSASVDIAEPFSEVVPVTQTPTTMHVHASATSPGEAAHSACKIELSEASYVLCQSLTLPMWFANHGDFFC